MSDQGVERRTSSNGEPGSPGGLPSPTLPPASLSVPHMMSAGVPSVPPISPAAPVTRSPNRVPAVAGSSAGDSVRSSAGSSAGASESSFYSARAGSSLADAEDSDEGLAPIIPPPKAILTHTRAQDVQDLRNILIYWANQLDHHPKKILQLLKQQPHYQPSRKVERFRHVYVGIQTNLALLDRLDYLCEEADRKARPAGRTREKVNQLFEAICLPETALSTDALPKCWAGMSQVLKVLQQSRGGVVNALDRVGDAASALVGGPDSAVLKMFSFFAELPVVAFFAGVPRAIAEEVQPVSASFAYVMDACEHAREEAKIRYPDPKPEATLTPQ